MLQSSKEVIDCAVRNRCVVREMGVQVCGEGDGCTGVVREMGVQVW